MAEEAVVMNTTNVDAYLRDGCGRCELYQTEACKVRTWTAPLEALRAILLASGLAETMKWGSPCYTADGKNVALLASLKTSCTLSFFRGAELVDAAGLLQLAGPNSKVGRVMRFQSVDDVLRVRNEIASYLAQAAALEAAGKRPPRAPVSEPLPEELARRLAADPALSRAFEGLTPGRRRGHALYVASAKLAETRARRVERCVPLILAGLGFEER